MTGDKDKPAQPRSTVIGDVFANYKTRLFEFLIEEFGHERDIHIALLNSAARDIEAIARQDFLNKVNDARAKALPSRNCDNAIEGEKQ